MSLRTLQNYKGVAENVRVTAMLAGGASPLGRPDSVAGRTRIFSATSSKGFTLLEILVACAILALIMVLGYQITFQSLRGKEKMENRSKTYQFVRVAMDKLNQDISMAFLLSGEGHLGQRQGSPQLKTIFKGDEKSMTFASLSHRRLFYNAKESESTEIGYRLDQDEENRDLNILMRREASVLDKNPEEGGIWFPLAEGIKDLKFEYYDSKEHDWRSSWSSETDAPLRLPRAVRMTLTVESPVKKAEPLIFRSIAMVEMYANPIDF